MATANARVIWDLSRVLRPGRILETEFTTDWEGNPVPAGRLVRVEFDGKPLNGWKFILKGSGARGGHIVGTTVPQPRGATLYLILVIETS